MGSFALLMFLVCATALTSIAAGQSRLTAVPLKVTVNAQQTFYPMAGTATNVTPDALGPLYVDGVNGVCASLDTHGDLIVNLSCKGNSASRQFGVNLGTSIAPPTPPATSCNAPNPTISPSNPPLYTNWISTWQAADMNTAAFQKMTVDPTGNTVYYVQFSIMTVFYDASRTIYYLNYRRTDNFPDFPDTALTSYAQVRRLSLTQWVVESATPNTAMLVEHISKTTGHQTTTTTTECGFYTVPFSFTLAVR